MRLRRRQLLQILSYAFGAGFILSKIELPIAAQSPAQLASPAPPGKPVARHESRGTEMEKVAGIGGLFFRAHDPKALGNWYQQHLGIELTPTAEGGTVWQQEAGPTAFSPFPETTKYFGDPNKVWMVNFRVHNLDKMVAQLRTAGIEVKDPESYPNIGRFARLHDLREIPSNCGSLHRSALQLGAFDPGLFPSHEATTRYDGNPALADVAGKGKLIPDQSRAVAIPAVLSHN